MLVLNTSELVKEVAEYHWSKIQTNSIFLVLIYSEIFYDSQVNSVYKFWCIFQIHFRFQNTGNPQAFFCSHRTTYKSTGCWAYTEEIFWHCFPFKRYLCQICSPGHLQIVFLPWIWNIFFKFAFKKCTK